MRGISKRFPGVVALDDVTLTVHRAEVVGLIGENGAGKSTLMKILGGVYPPDAGQIFIEGQPVQIQSVTDAIRLGIGLIHQELNVLDNIDVAGNVFLGREPRRGPGLIDRRKIYEQTEPFLRRLGLDVSSRTSLRELSIAQQQLVEIAKALSLNARILIMDEPTSSLTLAETQRLLELVLELQKQGVSIVYISHRLAELDHIADRVVGLRDGRNAGELSADEINHDRMVRMMVGRDIHSFYVEPTARGTPGYFRVRNVRSTAYPECTVSFDAGRGEILGFAGLVGAGRSEMAKTIFGVDGPCTGTLQLGDQPLTIRCVGDAIAQGLYLVPEDRRGTGLVTEMTVRENITLPALSRYAVAGLTRLSREREVAARQIQTLRIKAPTAETLACNLSGGNQQKVVLGKWLSLEPKVMIFDEPTRGIDVGAKAEIYRLMRDLAAAGTVVLMISSDMEEILHVSDRVAVMHSGRITGVLERAHCTEENIMQLAVGRHVPVAKPPCEQGAVSA
jgi:ribose transport system ATP-binding protein